MSLDDFLALSYQEQEVYIDSLIALLHTDPTTDVFLRYIILSKFHSLETMRRTIMRPGIYLSPEQHAAIRAKIESGETAQAQTIILDVLKKEFE